MADESPLPAYVLGAACITLGLHCLILPTAEYSRFGLPLESLAKTDISDERHRRLTSTALRVASPLVYLKGIREITYGLALVVLQYHGNTEGVTIMAAILSLAGLGDGIVVWLYGGSEFRNKAFGHWAAFAGFSAWAAWRAINL